MKIFLVPKEGVRLYHELLASETSRDALRFYRPVDTPCGIEITAASLGSALALIADIRWYVKRYMRGVLFEVSPGIYCSHRLAWEIFYEREIKLPESWDYRLIYRMKEGKVIREEQVVQGGERPLSGTSDSPEIEVWCTEDEYHGGSSTVEGEEIEPESSDENQESP